MWWGCWLQWTGLEYDESTWELKRSAAAHHWLPLVFVFGEDLDDALLTLPACLPACLHAATWCGMASSRSSSATSAETSTTTSPCKVGHAYMHACSPPPHRCLPWTSRHVQ